MQDPRPDDPAELLLRWNRHRDGQALERLLALALPRAWQQAQRTLGAGADAEDATQEALVQLVRTAARFDGSVVFGAWLGRLVKDACASVRRAAGRRRRHEQMAAAMSIPPAGEPDPVDAALVRAAVAELPRGARDAIELHYFAGLSQAEAATALGLSESTFAVRVHRARAALRPLLRARGVGVSAATVLAACGSHASAEIPAGLAATPSLLAQQALAGAALPASYVAPTLLQKGWLFMAAHPLLVAGTALALTVIPLVSMRSAEAAPEPAPWRGAAGRLLTHLDPTMSVQAGLDGESLRARGRTLAPTSLLADPAAQAAVAHALRQFQLVCEQNRQPAWHRLLADGRGFAFGLGGQGEQLHPQEAEAWPMMMLFDSGPAGGTFYDSLTALFRNEATQDRTAITSDSIGDFHGMQFRNSAWLGRADDAIALVGRMSTTERALAKPRPPDPQWLRSPAWFSADAAHLVSLLHSADADDFDPYHFSPWLPDWRARPPRLMAALQADAGTWGSRIELRDGPDLLRPLAPEFPDLPAADAVAYLAAGTDPQALARVVTLLVEPTGAQVAPLTDLVTSLSGQLVLRVRSGFPLPVIDALIGVADSARARDGLSRLLEQQPTRNGTAATWNLLTPVGNLSLRLAEGLLAITSDPRGLSTLTTSPRQAVAPRTCLRLRVDTPALARQWLPLLWAHLDTSTSYLPSDLLNGVIALAEGVQVRGLADANFWDLKINQPSHRRWLTRLFNLPGDPQVPFGERLAASLPLQVAVYGDQPQSALLLRTAEGWVFALAHAAKTDGQAAMPDLQTLSEDAVRQRLHGLRHRAGPTFDQLPVLDLPELPTFDRRWLPSVEVIVRHLAPWEVDIQREERIQRLSERGLPLLGIAAAALGLDIVFREQGAVKEVARLRDQTEAAAITARHAPVVALVRRLAREPAVHERLDDFQRTGDFIRQGLLTLDEAAVLNDGKPVADAAAADQIGTWVDRHNLRHWRVTLEGSWVVAWYPNLKAIAITCTGPRGFPAQLEDARPATTPVEKPAKVNDF